MACYAVLTPNGDILTELIGRAKPKLQGAGRPQSEPGNKQFSSLYSQRYIVANLFCTSLGIIFTLLVNLYK